MVTFSANRRSFVIIMHAASAHFSRSEKEEGFVLARFCLEMAYVFLLNGCFLPGSGMVFFFSCFLLC